MKIDLFCKLLVLSLTMILQAGCESKTLPQVEQTMIVRDTVFASVADSLEWVLANGTNEDKMSAGFDLAKHYSYTNVSLSRRYAQDLLQRALQAKDKKREADAYRSMIYYSTRDSSLYYADKALKIYEEIRDDTLAVFVKLNKAVTLGQLSRNEEALALMQECIDYYTKNNMEYRRANTIQAMGAMYGDMQLHELANEHYAQALAIYETLDKNEAIMNQMGQCYSNSGENFFRLQDLEKALEYSEKALQIFRQIHADPETVRELVVLSTRYLVLGKNEEALRYLNEADTLLKKTDNDVLRSQVYQTRAIYHAWNDDYKQAFDYAKQALAFTDSTNKRAIYIIYSQLATFSAFAGTPLETETYISKYSAITREVINDEWSSKLTEMQTKYETAKKENEISRQQQIISKQNTQRGFFIASVLVLLVFLVLLWYMLRLRSRRNLVLAEMNATKDKFFSIISHDLKNPALVQRDALKLLAENARFWSAEQLSAYHNELLKSADGHVELIYNLLGWSQIQTGRITCNPNPFMLSDLHSDLTLIHNMAENKGITFSTNIPANTIITADRNILTTVVRNLLTNAVKFTSSGGSVTLQCNTDEPFRITFTVTDTGIGMTPQQIKNLFRIDSQCVQKGTAGEQGTGLGLIVCKELLEKHGSALHVESIEGKGCRFWFTI